MTHYFDPAPYTRVSHSTKREGKDACDPEPVLAPAPHRCWHRNGSGEFTAIIIVVINHKSSEFVRILLFSVPLRV